MSDADDLVVFLEMGDPMSVKQMGRAAEVVQTLISERKKAVAALRPFAAIGKQIKKTKTIRGSRRIAVRACHLLKAADGMPRKHTP